jgi:hypothetical protein
MRKYLQCILRKRDAILTKNNSTVSVGTGEAAAAGIVVNSCTRSIQSKDTQDQAKEGDGNVENGETDLAGTGKPLAVVEVQPVDTGETVAEPGSEESTDQTVQITEDRNGLGDDPRNNPARNSKSDPETDGALVTLVHQARLGAETEVNVLQANVAVDDTGTNNGWDGNAVGDLAHEGSSGVEGGGLDVSADIEVDHNGGGQVERDLEALEHEQRLLEVARSLHLGDQTKEGDMSAVGEDNVRHSLEGGVQVFVDSSLDHTTRVAFNTHGNHSDHDSAENAQEGGERDPGHALHGSGDREGDGEDHTDDTENDGTGAVVGNSVHHDTEGEEMAAHDEDTEKELANTEQFAAEAAEEDLAGITQVLDVRVTFTEETNVVSSVCCEQAKANNENDTWDKTQGSDGRGQ